MDFYSAKLKLVVEIDGESHIDKQEYDGNRDAILNGYDLKVIHYDDEKVLGNFHLIEKDFKKQIELREKELGLK